MPEKLTVTGGNNAANTRGTIGMSAGIGSTIDSSTGKATIDVKGDKSTGVYSRWYVETWRVYC